MADVAVHASNVAEKWAQDFFAETVRGSRFARFMGTGTNSVIQVREDMIKEAGDGITLPLITRLTGAGVADDATLEGSEEALGNYGHKIELHELAHAVRIGAFEKIKSEIDLLAAAKDMLKLWAMEKMRDDVIARLQSPHTDGTTAYASATEGNKDAWCAANNPTAANQRILFGAAQSNSSGDHSVDLAKIDSSADEMHQDLIGLARRMAQTADHRMRPTNSGSDDYDFFVMFMGSIPFRDLFANYATVLQNGMPRGAESNPLFQPGDVWVNGVLCVEVPEIASIAGVGDSGIAVAPTFLCGAQALGLAWSQRTKVLKDSFDYGRKQGVGIQEIRGIEKLTYNSKQHGVVTAYVSGAA